MTKDQIIEGFKNLSLEDQDDVVMSGGGSLLHFRIAGDESVRILTREADPTVRQMIQMALQTLPTIHANDSSKPEITSDFSEHLMSMLKFQAKRWPIQTLSDLLAGATWVMENYPESAGAENNAKKAVEVLGAILLLATNAESASFAYVTASGHGLVKTWGDQHRRKLSELTSRVLQELEVEAWP